MPDREVRRFADRIKRKPEQNNNSAERAWDFRTASNTWQWYALWAMFFLSTTAGPAIYADARAMKG